MYFTGNDGYQNFLVFPLMLSSLTLDSYIKVGNWILTEISSEKTNIGPTMCNLAHGRVILKFNNSVLVQKKFRSLYSNFLLNLYILYELNT